MSNFASLAQIRFAVCVRTHGWASFGALDGFDAVASKAASENGDIALFSDGSALIFNEENGKTCTTAHPARIGEALGKSVVLGEILGNSSTLNCIKDVVWNGKNWEL